MLKAFWISSETSCQNNICLIFCVYDTDGLSKDSTSDIKLK